MRSTEGRTLIAGIPHVNGSGPDSLSRVLIGRTGGTEAEAGSRYSIPAASFI